jgi:hypothetical protein
MEKAVMVVEVLRPFAAQLGELGAFVGLGVVEDAASGVEQQAALS